MMVFKVHYDKGGGSKSLGARCGPEAIERAFREVSWRGAEDGTPHPELQWMHHVTSLKQYREQVELACTYGFTAFITLSGDNSCSFETVRAVARHVEHIALVIFDAHPDACDSSHDPHAHWVRKLWDEGIVMPEKTIFFGIRDAEEAETQYVKERQATMLTADDVYFSNNNTIARYRSLWQPTSTHGLVIVVDIDALDPAYAPGTGVLRAGGLNVRHILRIIRSLYALPFAVKIGEICEVIPKKGNRLRSRSEKRPDPCGLTIHAAEAIFRGMIRSLSA